MATGVSNLVLFQITHYEGLTSAQKQPFKADLDSLTDKSSKSEVLNVLNMTESAFDNSSIAIYTSFNSLLSDMPTLSTLTQKDLVDVLVDASELANISGFVYNSTESWPSWLCQIQYNVCIYWLIARTELAVDGCGTWNNLGCAVMLVRGYAQCTGDYINCRLAD